MSKPIVLIDMDEVLVDLLAEWCKHYHQVGGELLAPDHFKSYHWENQVDDKELFLKVLKSGAIFSSAPARPGAVEGFKALCTDFDVYIVTAVMRNCSRTYDAKLGWLWRHFPWFDRGRVIFTTQKHLVNGDFLIDDSVANLEKWTKHGRWRKGMGMDRYPILMNRPFNQAEDDYYRVLNLVDAHTLIKT